MSLHPRFEELRSFAEGGERRARLAPHLAGCAACRETVTWIRAVRSAVREDAPSAPGDAWDRIVSRMDAGEVVLLPVEGPRRRASGPWLRSTLARAAVLVLGLAGAGYALIPGSPVRSWVAHAVRSLGEAGAPAADPSRPPAAGDAGVSQPAAVLLVPAGSDGVRIAIESPGPRLLLRIRFDAPEPGDVEVRATGRAAASRFLSGPGRLTISEAEAGEIRISIPPGVERASIAVDDRPYVVKEGAEIRILAPADTSDAEIVLPVRD